MPTMKEIQVTPEEIMKTMTRLCNWKAPGIHKIHKFWWKKLTCVYDTSQLLTGSLEIVSASRKMKLGFAICAVIKAEKGKVTTLQNITLMDAIPPF